MNLRIQALVFSFLVFANISASHSFKPLLPEEISALRNKDRELSFWTQTENGSFVLAGIYSKQQTFLGIICFGEKALSELNPAQQSLFTTEEILENDAVITRHSWWYNKEQAPLNLWPTLSEMPLETKAIAVATKPSCYLIPTTSVADIICDKKNNVAIYTGAGISAKQIPTMQTLCSKLGLIPTIKSSFLATIKKTLDSSFKYHKIFDEFFYASATAQPTKAHLACLTFAKKGALVLTENVDSLHEATGVLAVHREQFDAIRSELASITHLICVGMSVDNSGLIAEYRKANPNGTVITVNQQIPAYSTKDDFLILGDAQAVLPQIEAFINKKQSSL